jgi:hypothetical protein
MNQQIATAAEQQSAVAEEINRSVLNVRDVSEQTSAASEENCGFQCRAGAPGGLPAKPGRSLQGLTRLRRPSGPPLRQYVKFPTRFSGRGSHTWRRIKVAFQLP